MQVTVASLLKLRAFFETSRRLLKKMGDSAGVGIEPAEQTDLCDATALLPGVVAAGVPGAGGVDAIFAITYVPIFLFLQVEFCANQLCALSNNFTLSPRLIVFYFFVLLFFCSLSAEVRAGVEHMWSKWDVTGPGAHNSQHGQGLAAAVCPLTLSAGKGLRAGIVAHFNGSENCI